MSVKQVSASILRNNLADVLDTVKNKEIMLVNRRKKTDVALIDVDLLEDLLELHDKEYVKSIIKARKQAEEGSLSTFEQVFGDL